MLLGCLLLSGAPVPAAEPRMMRQNMTAYLEALNRHDVEAALSYLAEGFRIEFVGTEMSMDREQARNALEWDAGAGGSFKLAIDLLTGSSVQGLFTETNEFLRLVGIPELRSRNTFTFDEEGRIVHQAYEMLPDQPSFLEAMEPAVAWAGRHRPEELAVIYPDGVMTYNREMAQRWVVLLREWRGEETEP